MMLRQLSVILTGALLLGTAGVVAPLASAHVPVMLAQAEDEGISAGEMITVEDGDPDFVEDAEYEVMEDTEGVLFVEGEDGNTWEIISVSEDGDDIELEYDGRSVSGDDVDS